MALTRKSYITALSLLLIGLFVIQELRNRDTKTLRIGVAGFLHETCTFCPNETGIAEWEYYGSPRIGDEVLSSGSYIGGFVDRCKELGGVELVGIYSPRGAKGGSSGS